MWIVFACLSAVFANLTAILCKCGIKKTDSDVATALRTIVVLIFAWIMTFVVGSYNKRFCQVVFVFDFVGTCDRRVLDMLLQGALYGGYK